MPYLEIALNLPLDFPLTYLAEEEIPVGSRVQVYIQKRKMIGWVVNTSNSPPSGVKKIKPIESRIDKEPLFGQELLELARWLAHLTITPLGITLGAMIPGKQKEKDGAKEKEILQTESINPNPRKLSSEQKEAISIISSNPNETTYLYGATGSGKTEVFLNIADEIMAGGMGVIYLVPEIALSHNLVDEMTQRFGNKLAILHSGLKPSVRMKEWLRIQRGEASFVLGARSAVFAPLKKIGLIIIDEEHENSYKSSSAPRYHARQVAMRRCRTNHARLLMGSATPSVEAWEKMKSGQLFSVNLSGRPAGGSLPSVSIVDLKKEQSSFSGELIASMSRILYTGGQVLLFLNRRGYSYRFSCSSCKAEFLCKNCSVPLTFHKKRNRMLCHYCGYQTHSPSVCMECGSVDVRAGGFGTENVEEEALNLFPDKRIVRLDADSTRKKGVLEKTLHDFRTGAIDVLSGTQIIAKGLNAPGLKLSVLLCADTSLNIPDFRAAERTFSLITQVAGRAGRFSSDGEVIVQTLRPESPVIQMSAEGRTDDFYTYEIEQRRLLRFPPFTRIFRVAIKGRFEESVRRNAEELVGLLNQNQDGFEILGPAECPISRIAGNYRCHVIIRTEEFDRTHEVLRRALKKFSTSSGIKTEIDIDPLSLM